MTTIMPPEFLNNKQGYYRDPRVSRLKLTDKATKKDLDSYIEHYLRLYSPTVTGEQICNKIREDILDYRKNKDRYTIKDNKLVAIDGKPVDTSGIKLEDIVGNYGGFLD